MVHGSVKLIDFGECFKDVVLCIQIDEGEQVCKIRVFLCGFLLADSWNRILWFNEGDCIAWSVVHLISNSF